VRVLTPRTYRSTIGIILDILRIIKKHKCVTVSFLVRESNVPYVRLKPLLDKLKKGGYIIVKKTSQVDIALTEKGLKLLAQLELLKDTLGNIGIKI